MRARALSSQDLEWLNANCPGLTTFLKFNISMMALRLALLLFLAFLFLSKKRILPKVMVTLIAFNLVLALLNHVWGNTVLRQALTDTQSTAYFEQMAKAVKRDWDIAGVFAWFGIPYFLLSKRVKATFTR